MRWVLLLPLVTFAAPPTSALPDSVHVPSAWKRIDVGPFSFYAPPDLHDHPLEGKAEDSYVREFRGSSIDLMFDYGLYSNSLGGNEGSDFRWHMETVAAKPAKFASYTAPPAGNFRFEHFFAVYFGSTDKPKMRLTMYASCEGLTSCMDVQDLFRSIRFN